jgi:hypothetical protein
VTFARVVHGEWIKFRSLRSTYWTLGAALVVMGGFSALLCWAQASRWSHLPPAERAAFTPVEHSLRGYFVAQMIVGVLGVLMISGEYSTGMIRASLSAVPRRLPVLGAKAAVFGAVTWVVATVAALVAFFLGQAILNGEHIGVGFSTPGAPRVVLGMGLYLTAVGLLAVGLGALLRNTAAGIASVFGIMMVLPLLVEALPSSWGNAIGPYLPSNAGGALTTLHQQAHQLSPWTGFLVMCLYVVAALVGGGIVLRRRDA